jgi:Protein of unknown function (DUF3142)
MPRIFFVLLLASFGLARSSGAPPSAIAQDAYVWQRVWTPAVLSALGNSADLVTGWRVLAAETDARGNLRSVAVNWAALSATHQPVIAVIRIDGSLANWDEDALLAKIGTLAAGWRELAVPPAGIEIDYDCGTARLAFYAQFLARLRSVPDIPRRLSITALPAWLSARELERVIAAADEVVLQVHAVRAPTSGLFDPALARSWIDEFGARTTKPFRVALPDYGARVVQADDGRIVAIESEEPRLAGGARTTELMAMPADVAQLLGGLARDPSAQFAGVVWFRLPTGDDALVWSPETWRAVMHGEDLRTDVVVVARPGATAGLSDIVLLNRGRIDAELPRMIGLPQRCTLADGVNGYALDNSAQNISLHRLQTALLHAHREQTIGWMRCARGNFDVRP